MEICLRISLDSNSILLQHFNEKSSTTPMMCQIPPDRAIIFVVIPGSITRLLQLCLEEAYEALRVFEILGIGNKPDVSATTCKQVMENLGSSSPVKDLFYALKVNGILKCKVNADVFKDIAVRVKATVNDASTLVDMYHSIASLVLIKDQASDVDVLLADADGIFHSIKALSQSDGRWRYSSDNPESSTFAAGLALEALAGVISLASSEIDLSRVSFNLLEKYFGSTLKGANFYILFCFKSSKNKFKLNYC